MVQNHSLKLFGFEQVEYFQIVHDLIEDYCLSNGWPASINGITLSIAGAYLILPELALTTRILMKISPGKYPIYVTI